MCKHKHVTPTAALADEGLFAVNQCDMCGALGGPVDADPATLPAIDMIALAENIRRKIDKIVFIDRPLKPIGTPNR